MFENPRRGRQARNFTTNVPKILDLKSSPAQIFPENWRWVPLPSARKPYRIGLMFTRKNGDVGAISVTERSCFAPRSLKWRVTYRIRVHTITDTFHVGTKSFPVSGYEHSQNEKQYLKLYHFNLYRAECFKYQSFNTRLSCSPTRKRFEWVVFSS